ncbi:helix-turn-helix domain-containing protein [Aquabacterium sp.]|uniref:helix-turn-helix domain-containing protein n=1 Tax=Aquabacterium sp. TaxID=1872578 RepID=UPI00351CFC5D
MAQAQKKGTRIGRGRVLKDEQIQEILCRVAGGAVKSSLAKEYKISRQTLYAA